jgi:hypothetical protein
MFFFFSFSSLNLDPPLFSTPTPQNEKNSLQDPTNRRPHHRRLLGHLPPRDAGTLPFLERAGLRVRVRQEIHRGDAVRYRAVPVEGAGGRGRRGL